MSNDDTKALESEFMKLLQYPGRIMTATGAASPDEAITAIEAKFKAPPTPEPVPVEDITPGWYFAVTTTPGVETKVPNYVLVGVQDSPGYRVSGPDCCWLEVAAWPGDTKWYRALSPEQLMAMCGERKATDDLTAAMSGLQNAMDSHPHPCNKCKHNPRACFRDEDGDCDRWEPPGINPADISQACAEARETATTSETFDDEYGIPPAVEVALRVLETKLWATLTDMWGNAQAVVRDYLAEHAPKEKPEPQNTRPCGECANWRERGGGICGGLEQPISANSDTVFPDCQSFTEKQKPIIVGHVTNDELRHMKAEHARKDKPLPENPIETCGECGQFFDADGMTDWRCRKREGFQTYPDNPYAKDCPLKREKTT